MDQTDELNIQPKEEEELMDSSLDEKQLQEKKFLPTNWRKWSEWKETIAFDIMKTMFLSSSGIFVANFLNYLILVTDYAFIGFTSNILFSSVPLFLTLLFISQKKKGHLGEKELAAAAIGGSYSWVTGFISYGLQAGESSYFERNKAIYSTKTERNCERIGHVGSTSNRSQQQQTGGNCLSDVSLLLSCFLYSSRSSLVVQQRIAWCDYNKQSLNSGIGC